MFPVGLPDKRSLFWSSADDGPPNLRVRRGGAEPEVLMKSDRQHWARSVTPDGKYGIYDYDDPKTSFDIYAVPLTAPHTPFPLVKSPARENEGQISPDGKWFAFVSNESGDRQTLRVEAATSKIYIERVKDE